MAGATLDEEIVKEEPLKVGPQVPVVAGSGKRISHSVLIWALVYPNIY